MSPRLRQAFDDEIKAARRLALTDERWAAFGHLERAHVLGQRSTRTHVRAHWEMLRLAWSRKQRHELFGQIPRLVAAALFSRIWVPEGNTGGTNVSAFRRMPIPADLAELLRNG